MVQIPVRSSHLLQKLSMRSGTQCRCARHWLSAARVLSGLASLSRGSLLDRPTLNVHSATLFSWASGRFISLCPSALTQGF